MSPFFYAIFKKGKKEMLKGKATFELRDINTGEVQKYENTNMFTNALNEIYNKAPYGFFNVMQDVLSNAGVVLDNSTTTTLGGLLLFPNPIAEDAETILAPASNKPTGIASVFDNPNTDNRRGSFNAIESAKLANGYKYVYDFSTSQANGLISCVSLTSAWGGATYLDDLANLLGGVVDSEYLAHGWYRHIKDEANSLRKVLGANQHGIFYSLTDNKTIQWLPIAPLSLSLMKSYSSAEVLGVIDTAGYMFLSSDHVNVMRTNGNSSGNATITIERYSIPAFEKTTNTYVVAAPLKATTANTMIAYDEKNDYLYCLGYNGTSYYKVKLSNPADVTKIDIPTSNSELWNFAPYFIGNNFLIEEDNTVHISETRIQGAFASRVGLYAIGGSRNWKPGIASYQNNAKFTSCNPFMSYLATICNLDNPINKTANQTMKVTYTVLEG